MPLTIRPGIKPQISPSLNPSPQGRETFLSSPLLMAPTFGSAPPLKACPPFWRIRGGRGSYDSRGEGRFIVMANRQCSKE